LPVRLFVTGRNTGPAVSAPWPATARYSLDQPLRHRMHRNEPDFAARAPDPKMHHALTAQHVPDQLLAAHP